MIIDRLKVFDDEKLEMFEFLGIRVVSSIEENECRYKVYQDSKNRRINVRDIKHESGIRHQTIDII